MHFDQIPEPQGEDQQQHAVDDRIGPKEPEQCQRPGGRPEEQDQAE